jgi:2-amino-4-hydroxy-6-hydroxymethyldihydropteridine diphosphokinase
VIKLDILENQAKLIYLGLGSNLGNRKTNIEKAKFRLLQKKIKILQSSSYYETLSWPDPKLPKYLNIVIKITSILRPLELLSLCKEIECKLGRKNSPKNSPRECDIDILDYNSLNNKNGLILPHPRMHLRNFVLFPLFEINKVWKHPVSKNDVKNLILSLSNKDIRSIKKF